MNKKITSSALAALMIAGSTSFSALAAMANGTVVIGTKAYDMAYANDPKNAGEIGDAIVAGGNQVYIKDFEGNWIDNATTKKVEASVIPAVVYKDAAGKESNFAAGDDSVNAEVKVKSITAISNTKVLVTLENDTNLSAADLTIVKKGTTTAVAVKSVTKEAAKMFVVETEALVGGQSYTVTANKIETNFTGIAADTTAPTVVKVSSTDTNVVNIEFSDRMDFASATNVANYTFNKDAKVVKAELDATRTKVTLTTEGLKRNIVYTLTAQNVLNSDAKVMTKVVRTLTATEDKVTPKITTLQVQNNHMVVIKFNDANGMNKESLENVANYSLNDLKILKAEAYDLENEDGLYDTVVITTEPQVTNKSYTLTMTNLTDNSTLKNALGTTTRGFRGASEDKTGPTVNVGSVKPDNNNTVDIEFKDTNALDKVSVEDISNYEIVDNSGQALQIISAEIWYDTYPENYTAGYKGVTLKTAQQEIGKTYRLTVKAVKDEFGNELKAISGTNYAKYTFLGSKIDTQAPFVQSVQYLSPTKVRLTFDATVSKAEAQDPTNYVFSGGLGSAVKAVRNPNKLGFNVVELTTQTQASNKDYTITINNLVDNYGNMLYNAKASFVSTADTLDVTAPSVSYVTVMNNEEVHVFFTEPLDINASMPVMTIREWDTSTSKFKVGALQMSLTAKGFIDEGQTVVYKVNGKLGDLNYKIDSLVGAKDAARNVLALPKEEDRDLFSGTTAANTPAELEYIEQVNAKTIRAHFSEAVVMNAFSGYTVKPTDSSSDNTYTNSWDIVKTTGNFEVAKEIQIDFTNCAKDIVGLGVADATDTTTTTGNKTAFTPYFEDLAKPVITGVVATNKDKVTITYDEALSTGGTYKIYYLDSKNNKVYVYSGAGTKGSASLGTDNLVTINLTTSLVSSKIYYIEPMTSANDIAGNKSDITDVKFDFPGSDIAVSSYINGVKIINGNTINIITGKSIKDSAAVTVFEYDEDNKARLVNLVATLDSINYGTLSDAATSNNTSKDSKFKVGVPVLQGKKYIVDVTFTDGKTESYIFEGNTPGIGAYIEKGGSLYLPGSSATLGFSAFDSKAFDIEVYDGTTLYAKIVAGALTGTNIALDTNNTPTITTDDVITFTNATAGIVGKQFYVVFKDTVDQNRIVYADKVAVGYTNATDVNVAAIEAAVTAANTAVLAYEAGTGLETTATSAITAAINLGANASVTDALTVRVTVVKTGATDAAAVNAFKAKYATELALTGTTVRIADKVQIAAALTEYDDVSKVPVGAKAILINEKAVLSSLAAKITELEGLVSNFNTQYSAVLGKTPITIAITDKAAVTSAVSAYTGLEAGVKAELAAENTLLDSLVAKIILLEEQLAVDTVAAGITAFTPATGAAGTVALPTVPTGYSIVVKTTSDATKYDTTGKILVDGTSNVVYTVTNTASGKTADTISIVVTVTVTP